MLNRTNDEKIAELEGQVKELTKVLSALIEDIDDHRIENTNSCCWWKGTFLRDLEVSDSLKEKLGLISNKGCNEDDL